MKVLTLVAVGLVAFLAVIVLSLLFSAPAAFVAMLLVGVLHSYVPQVPALGFIPVWIVLFLLGLVFNRNRVQTTSK